MSNKAKKKKPSRPAPKRPAPSSKTRKLPIGWIAFGVVAIALMVTLALTLGELDRSKDDYGDPTISGQALAGYADPTTGTPITPDPSIGAPIPEVGGAGFNGDPASITRDGRPKAIIFLAHWCPACQNEVPLIQGWLDDGGGNPAVDIIAVSTAMTDTRPNYPPSAWLEREGWTPPVIVDDSASSVYGNFGAGPFPYFVFVDAAGNVAARISGQIPLADLLGYLAALAATS